MRRKIFLIFSAGLIGLSLFTSPVLAQSELQNKLLGQVDNTGEEVFGSDATNQGDLVSILGQFIRVGLSFVGVILLVLFIYAGFLWMTAGGNEDRVKDAKRMLQNGIIGLIIVLSAFAITEFIFSALDATNISGGSGDAATGEVIEL